LLSWKRAKSAWRVARAVEASSRFDRRPLRLAEKRLRVAGDGEAAEAGDAGRGEGCRGATPWQGSSLCCLVERS
jgi:hypothetical protein